MAFPGQQVYLNEVKEISNTNYRVFSVRLPLSEKRRLEQISQATGLSVTDLVILACLDTMPTSEKAPK